MSPGLSPGLFPGKRGLLARLPLIPVVALAVEAELDFVAIDLVNGPFDEGQLADAAAASRAAGLMLLALVDDEQTGRRALALGVALLVDAPDAPSDNHLRLVARSAAPDGTLAFLALDLVGAQRGAIRRFAAECGHTSLPSPALDGVTEPAPLVLLPGQLGDVSVWATVAASLTDVCRCVGLRIDLDNTVEEMAQTVLAAAPRRFALAGHSLGGVVALEICRVDPERVSRLALVSASGRPASKEQRDAWSDLANRVAAGQFDQVVLELAHANLLADHPDVDRNLDRWFEMAATVGAAGLLRQLAAQTARPDSLPTLHTIRQPALVVSGSRDVISRPELQRELADGLPDARHVTLSDVGHMSPMESPDLLAQQLRRWLTADVSTDLQSAEVGQRSGSSSV